MELANGYTSGYYNVVTDEEIKASSDLTKSLAQIIMDKQAAKNAANAGSSCKKPVFNIGKKKKEYEKCQADAEARRQADLRAANQYTPPAPPAKTSAKPFFKTGAGVAVIAIGAVALALGTFAVITHFNKKSNGTTKPAVS